jgi:hypothetical protein
MTKNNQVFLFGYIKLLIVIVTVCISLLLVYNDNWFQGLLVLNISLHYRDFIDFFTDFSDEMVTAKSQLHESDDVNPNEPFYEPENLGPANIDLSNTYNELYSDYNIGEDSHIPQYSSFYNNNVNINNIIKNNNNNDNENFVAEKFYQQLYYKHEKNNNIIKNLDQRNVNTTPLPSKNLKPFCNENFTNYKLNEINTDTLTDFGSFSKLKFQKDQKINIRSKTLYPNDDIKLMNHIDLNHNIPWWQLSSFNDGFN